MTERKQSIDPNWDLNLWEQEFINESMDYLEEQGYPEVTWYQVVELYSKFADNPAPGLENEIDSLFTDNGWREDFIIQEQEALTRSKN